MEDRKRPPAELHAPAGSPGDGDDQRALVAQWFEPCVDVAYRILGDLDEAAEVAGHILVGSRPPTLGPRRASSPGAWALRATRDEALSRLNRRRGGDRPPPAAGGAGADAHDPDGVMGAAFAALGASDASALDLHLRHGFEVGEMAEALGVSANEAHQLLFRLKRRLGAALRAWAVWPGRGADGCAGLAGALAAEGVTAFGPDAVPVVTQHARSCDACQPHQGTPTAEADFAAVPVLAVPDRRERALAAVAEVRSAAGSAAPAGPDAAPPGAPTTAGAGAPGAGAADPAGPPPPLPSRVPGQSGRGRSAAGRGGPDRGDPDRVAARAGTGAVGLAGTVAGSGPDDRAGVGAGRPFVDTGSTPAVAVAPEPAPALAAGEHGAARPGEHTRGGNGHVAAAGAPAARPRTGDDPGASRYREPAPRRDRRQLAGIGLAVLLVLGVSLAIVVFTGGRGPGGDGEEAGPASSPPTSTAPLAPGEGDGGGDAGGDGATGGPAGDDAPATTEGPATGGPATTAAPPDAGGSPPPADAPEIERFQAIEQGVGTPCGQFQRRITLVWQTNGATEAQLDGPGAPTEPLRPSGRTTVCRDPGPPATYTLTVEGEGGTTFRTTTV
ncbi:MAG TPA: sigma-70 family RNA polymerase sigma factor [Acidimicrobiales bacterium]